MSMVKSEFSEIQYQCYIDRILRNDFIKGPRFEIEFIDQYHERDLGYDLVVKSHIPIFLQTKRSNFYPQSSSSKPITVRRSWGYKDQPGAYFFSLHEDRITKDYRQHNLLFELNNTNGAYARYVAPLFTGRRTLEELSYSLTKEVLWHIAPRILRENNSLYDWRDYVHFPLSVTILPHNTVSHTTGRHKYYFNDSGQISFHSDPVRLDDQSSFTFEAFLFEIQESLAEGKSIPFDKIVTLLSDAVKVDLFGENDKFKNLYDRSFLNSLYHEMFEKEVGPRQNVWKLAMRQPEQNIFRLLSRFIFEKHGISTFLASMS